MASAKTKATEKPLIQIDDVIREMTDEEYAAYLEQLSQSTPIGE